MGLSPPGPGFKSRQKHKTLASVAQLGRESAIEVSWSAKSTRLRYLLFTMPPEVNRAVTCSIHVGGA